MWRQRLINAVAVAGVVVGGERGRFAALFVVVRCPGHVGVPIEQSCVREGRRRDYRMEVGKPSRASKCLHRIPLVSMESML